MERSVKVKRWVRVRVRVERRAKVGTCDDRQPAGTLEACQSRGRTRSAATDHDNIERASARAAGLEG